MAPSISSRVDGRPPAGVDLLRKTTQELLKSGKKIISLSGGDPARHGFSPPSYVQEALVQAVRDQWHMYPAGTGWEPKLMAAIADREKRYHMVDYAASDIVPTPSSTQALNLLYLVLLDVGDNLVGPEPTYQQYFFVANYVRAEILTFPSLEENGWQPEVDQMRKKITNKTKGIIINNPNNPTSAIYDEKSLREMVNIAGEYDLPIISDEIYDQVTFDGVKTKSIASIANDVPTMVTNGMAKSFMATGWNVGYIAFHDPNQKIVHVKKACETLKMLTGRIATPISVAATVAYQNLDKGEKHLQEMINSLEKRRDLSYKRLNEIDGVSCQKMQAGLYGFPKVDTIGKVWKDDVQFMVELLKEQQVQWVPGSNYGAECGFGHFRALLLPEEKVLEEAYTRLETFLKSKVK